MSNVLINPSGELLWRNPAILAGRSRHHDVDRFAGPVSVKTVLSGSATWETKRGKFTVTPETYLVLSEGEEYSLTIRSTVPTETFCVFLAEGVGDAEAAAVLEYLKVLS